MEKMVSLSGVSMGNKGHNGGRALDTCQELGEGHLFPFTPSQDSPTGSACQPPGVGVGVEEGSSVLASRAPCVAGLWTTCQMAEHLDSELQSLPQPSF